MKSLTPAEYRLKLEKYSFQRMYQLLFIQLRIVSWTGE